MYTYIVYIACGKPHSLFCTIFIVFAQKQKTLQSVFVLAKTNTHYSSNAQSKHSPSLLENMIMSSLTAAIEMGNLSIVPHSRSKAITLYSPLGTGMVKLLLLLRGIKTSFILAKSRGSLVHGSTHTRAPGERVPSTYKMLTLIPPSGPSDTRRS